MNPNAQGIFRILGREALVWSRYTKSSKVQKSLILRGKLGFIVLSRGYMPRSHQQVKHSI